MVRRKPEDIGCDRWDDAPDSWLKCPCCGARAMVSHLEPHSGGGFLRHLHRCRRCRHEWEQHPEEGQACPASLCDAHERRAFLERKRRWMEPMQCR
ncbi:hypothetical protein LAZ40_02390 [Cereibacter sphaeroides]|uniref:hypothetical protein n=1 Tax=Cereibacter sphaeroides TaxID=1063 RepID=UPI001F3FE54A|nr:hypothetical protein [Cereibacter sphaeroides]MCE6957907.1 hypothetical protein [Cereibacter sphaeroides]MCE6971745.1 hypothetical protein [Cereibacter sphaeroides]